MTEKKPRGRPKGSVGPTGPRGPNPTGWASWLLEFEVGERRYLETTLEKYSHLMKVVLKPSYLNTHEVFKERKYTGTLVTGVSARRAGDIRYLICVEREQ